MKMRWAGHVARMWEMRYAIFWLENMKGRNHLEDLGVNVKIME
jgi:hypothetical protein